jgi:hypothetical protein
MANVLPWMGCGVGTARSAAAATPLERGRLRVMLSDIGSSAACAEGTERLARTRPAHKSVVFIGSGGEAGGGA